MSRIANNPVTVPSGVEITLHKSDLSIKGSKGTLGLVIDTNVEIQQEDGVLTFAARSGSKHAKAMAGTTRALVNNMVAGVSHGFEKRLELRGVGYRAKVNGSTLNLTLGFSHPVNYKLPDGVSAETPSQTEVVLTSINKQLLGQAAAEIRGFRPPEPYKGKGVRYQGEHVRRKEAKKK